ncbi:Disheveled-associated activator of morphogenesis 1 [Choanephora cucurbitarum]|uniref:Disheveled-associated activator of morphogenesis 1 n=1 Tax=Choanephora cucurbitarum TaxID=101091 RepID=A0A1C7MZV6_9FUNG|nr:Disheveled-associated activator of morphogenesis 1 [Choanephora cucurbitarum]
MPGASTGSPPLPPAFLGTVGRKPSAFHAKQKLKFVEWEKMNFDNIQETIWNEFERDIELSLHKQTESADSIMEYQLAKAGVFDDVELTFAQKPAVEIKAKPLKNETHILDTKKSYNLNILIKNIIKKIPFDEIRYYFLQLDSYFMDEQIILNLLKYLPTEDEATKLSAYHDAPLEEVERLGVPEKFCLQMIKIDRLKERLECMLFKSTFFERYTVLHKQMTSVYNASIALRDAKYFKELLHLVLLLGNFLNGNTYRGGAFGIKIASINKLIDTKGTSKSTTLLHFLVDAVEKNFPYVLAFLEELDECGLASKVSRSEMIIEYQNIEADLGKLEAELRDHYPNKHKKDEQVVELDKFASTMHKFYKQASSEFKRICMLSKKMEESYEQAVRFYGEDPKKTQPDEFFGIFKEFTTSWEKCSADSREHKLKQDRIEKQKKREQERRKRANSNAGAKLKDPENEEDKAILHSLLDKLKKDTLDVKVRRRSDRRSRQRSTSISQQQLQQSFSTQQPNIDSIYLKANKMLRNIQGENSTSLLVDGGAASPTIFDFGHSHHLHNTMDKLHGGRRRMSASVAIRPSFMPLLYDSEATDSPMLATPSTSLLNASNAIPEETKSTLLSARRHARPLSALVIPKPSMSSQSHSSNPTPTTTAPARQVRIRKTSKRPIFDHSLRIRARRMSTR